MILLGVVGGLIAIAAMIVDSVQVQSEIQNQKAW